ncbi:MAG: cell division protein FtsQ/DivIB [Thiohalomonadaceae bacterium]
MAKKRQAKRKQDKQKFSLWLGYLMGVAGLVTLLGLFGSAAWWLAQPEHLPLRIVRVQGDLQHVSAEEIRAAVLPYTDAGFLYVDINAVRSALEELPWVYGVQVRRTWPDVLHLQVQEQQALARWGDGGLVNQEGKVFYPANVSSEYLPVLRGPQGTSVMVTTQFIELQHALWDLQINIAEVVMDERRSWRLRLDNGLELMLGRNGHPARMERFRRAWPHVLAPRSATVERVDLR